MRHDRRGFTLVELIVVTVLGALVIMAALQILITNQRTYTAQNAAIQGQQSLRAGVDLLMGELREVSASDGDLLVMADDSVTVRVMRKLGIACQVDTTNTGNPYVVALRLGDWFAAQDSVYIYADNDEDLDRDDEWIQTQTGSVDTTVSCSGLGALAIPLFSGDAQELSFPGQKATFSNDSVRVGAPLRSYLTYTYGLYTYDGKPYLGRTTPGGDMTPLVGPLQGSDGLAFEYRDGDGNTTTTATDVRQIVVTLRSGSEVVSSVGELVSDSIRTWIYTRN